jgi:hypothetical protein
VFSGLFLFYKSFVSSQDAQSCSFTPSCSVYALEAVKNQGNVYLGVEFILGSINDDGTTEKTYNFSDEQNIDIKSHLELTVKVNQ